ncbi:MAG: sensor histidine kinase [Oscillospiraceae bacterium]
MVIAVVMIVVMVHNDNHALAASPTIVTFHGEYKAGSGNWQPIESDTRIICLDGEVRLKGYFQLEFTDGTVLGGVPKGISLITYFDHIGGEIYVDGQLVHEFDMENKLYGYSSCGADWISFDCPTEENEIVEIVLKNPHKYGNGNAVDTFLGSMYTYSGAAFDRFLSRQNAPQKTFGIVITVISFIILGVAIFSTILKVPYSGVIWIFGFMLLFAGGFFVLDLPNYCIGGSSSVFNSIVKLLCIILYPEFMFLLTENCLRDKLKKAGGIVAGVCGVFSVAAVIIAFTGKMLIYNLNYYMLMIQLAAALALIVLCVVSLKGSDLRQVIMTAVCLAALSALAVDIVAVFMGVWHTAAASKLVFAAVFVPALFYSLKFIPQNINAGLREKELQLELQENRMSVMLSQIQPHFLYNALSAICDLCGSEPLKARDALVDFSVYLRENMDSISSRPVRFYRELSHINTYLRLEKLRFGDKINAVYDIEAEDFEIQPLTVQPIVENAVKHGICVKENGGTITLKTSEENGTVTITVADDGVGFDVNSVGTEGGMRSHIGLENVRKRVEKYPGGKLTVESEIGKGTVVTISFRK